MTGVQTCALPILGKIIIKKATIADVSKKSGIEENKIIAKLNKMIDSHQK